MAYEAMFATISPFLVIYDNTSKASINLQKLTKLESLTLPFVSFISTVQELKEHLPDKHALCNFIHSYLRLICIHIS
jgi:hypothetical protein